MPPKNVMVRMDEALLEQLDELAREEERSRNSVIVRILRTAVAKSAPKRK